MARRTGAALIGAWLSAALWVWIAALILYWATIAEGLRRFYGGDRSHDMAGSCAFCDIALVIPAYNEATHVSIIERMMSAGRAADIGTTVVDDGSHDESSDSLAAACTRHGAHLIRHPDNRGKAAALCSGLASTRTSVLMTLDADTIAPLEQIICLSIPPEVGAVAFTIAANDADDFLTVAQAIEYAYVLNFERMAFAGFGIVLTVPGAASLWRTAALNEIGGFSGRTAAEDCDATLALQMKGWRALVVPDIVATSECPNTAIKLIRQRARWIWGNLQATRYAAAAYFDRRATVRRAPAVMMALASLMIMAGYTITTATLIRVVAMDVHVSDVIAATTLLVATVIRIVLTREVHATPQCGIVTTLSSLLSMQAVNLLGFWYGALGKRHQW